MKIRRNGDNREKYGEEIRDDKKKQENTLPRQMVKEALDQVNRVILGKQREIQEIMLAFLAGGHVLLEDIPGVGKTTLAVAFSQAMRLEYRRVQFTPDVLPSDLTGFSIYRREEERFVYQPGSVFCNLLLADEINRTSPKIQSALLEVMEERKVTVDGVTRKVPSPFLVIATQNPAGTTGTQYLPEAQVDRFMVSLTLGYPDFESELAMARDVGIRERLDAVRPVLTGEMLEEMQKAVGKIYVKESLYRYLLELVRATRSHPYLQRGASPRATIALVRMAKASAWLKGREYVIPSDISGQFSYVMGHRILPGARAGMDGKEKREILEDILKSVKVPEQGDDV